MRGHAGRAGRVGVIGRRVGVMGELVSEIWDEGWV